MDVEKWLNLVTERRDITTAIRYATGDTFLPEWPDDMAGWDEADRDEFRESEKERWFERHRKMHLAVLSRRYGGERNVA